MLTTDHIWSKTIRASHNTVTVDDERWRLLQELFQLAYVMFSERPTISPELIKLVRRVGFRLATLPLPATHREIWGGDPEKELARLRSHLLEGDTDVLHKLADALDQLLSENEVHPMWKSFLNELPEMDDPISIVTLRTTSISSLLSNFQSTKQVSILPLSELPRWYSQSTTVVFGPPSAYPSWLKLFPPSDCLWIHFSWNRGLEIPSQLSQITRTPRKRPDSHRKLVPPDERKAVHAIDGIAERWDENDIAARVKARNNLDDGTATVLARAALLANDSTMLISAEPGTFTHIFDPYNRKVSRRESNRLIPGMFIIGRESGGKDYIRSIVDNRILTNASEVRATIESWKTRLSELIDTHGLQYVVNELDSYGVVVEPQTVNLWRTELIHGPSRPEWLEVLFEVLGMREWNRHWLALQEIRRAGRKAGRLVRSELLEQVESVDYETAQTAETLRFTLDGVDDGGLTAHRLEELGSRLMHVPAGLIGELLGADSHRWP